MIHKSSFGLKNNGVLLIDDFAKWPPICQPKR
jgi:hypothetical protein